MRVALVAEDYYPQVGGVPEHTHFLSRQLRAWGHTADIFTSNMRGQHGDPPWVRRIGTSRLITANGGDSRITTGWGIRRQLREAFRGHYDVVHVQGGLAPTFGVLAPLAAKDAGIPVVATFHSWFPRSLGYQLLKRPFRWLLDHHAVNIAVSQPVVDAMSRYFPAVEWTIIPNGVDVTFFQPDGRPPAGPPGAAAELLFLARLEQRNALATVLAAMPRILHRFPRARLTVVGDGPQRAQLEREAAPLGDRVRFVGEAWKERPAFYQQADLFLCPTTRASFGVTLIESMACGTPIVASDITGFREVIDGGEEALLIPPGDPASWASGVIALLEDPARRRRMAAAGLAKARRFDWSRVAAAILAVYQRAGR